MNRSWGANREHFSPSTPSTAGKASGTHGSKSRHQHLRGRARFITGVADPKQADLVFLRELIDAGRLRTVIGRRYTLDDIVDAHRYADTGHKVGNVAVVIGD